MNYDVALTLKFRIVVSGLILGFLEPSRVNTKIRVSKMGNDRCNTTTYSQ